MLEDNKRIREIERENKITMTPEQKQLIYNRRLGNSLDDAIDRKVNEVMESNKGLFAQGKHDKLMRWWNGFSRGKIVKTAVSVAGSTALRTGLSATGAGMVAGSITGFLMGGAIGAWSARQAEQQKQFGAGGIIAQYNRLKNQPGDGSREQALAFLQSYLEQLGDNNREKRKFIGNAGEFLQILCFYQAEMKAITAVNTNEQDHRDRLVSSFSNYGKVFNKDFVNSANEAIRNSTIKGGLRGALIGLGIGAVSDVISWIAHGVKYAHVKNDYIREHIGHDNEFHPQAETVNQNLTPDVQFNQLNEGQGLGLLPTDYGNALSRAVRGGLESGQLHLPQAFIDQAGGNQQEAIRQFLYNLNFVQPEHASDWWKNGQTIDFNIDGVQQWMNNAVAGGTLDEATHTWMGGHIDIPNYANQLKDGGNWLANNYPTGGEMQNLYHGGNAMILQDAAQSAAPELIRSDAEAAIHGAAIGLGVAKTSLDHAAKIAKPEKESGKKISGGSGDTERPPARRQTGTTTATAENRTEENPEETPLTVETPNPEPEIDLELEKIDWEQTFTNYETFFRTANKVLKVVRQKDWAEMNDKEKDDFVGLFNFISEYNGKGLRFRFVLKAPGSGSAEDYQIEESLSNDSPMLATRTLDGGTARVFDFTAKGTAVRLDYLEREPNDLADPEIISFDQFKEPDGEIDYDLITDMFALAKDEKKQLGMRIERANNRRLFNGDDGTQRLEIISVRPTDGKLVIITAKHEIKEISKNNFDNIANIKNYTWTEGGGDYDRRR